MKNVIMYYYDFDNPSIYRWQKKIYIKNKNDKYIFQPTLSEKETIEIYNLLKNNNKYYNFILNKFNKLITPYKGNFYILLKIPEAGENRLNEDDIILNDYIVPMKYELDRSDWYFLWTQKNDYFEYQLNHIYGKYPLIDETIDYFIGMAETAISYIKYNNVELPIPKENLVIAHRRINENDFYNPLSIVIDTKERDIGEYLKYLFYSKNYNKQKISNIINNSNLDSKGFHRIYARLLYPSYYFDIYEGIINGNMQDKELHKIIDRIDEYENYLNEIYKLILTKVEIRKVDWIQKK